MPRKFSAHYIFPGGSAPLKRGIVVVDDDSWVTDLIDTHGNLSESQSLIFYDGIITPGFPDISLFQDGFLPAPDFYPVTSISIQNTTVFGQLKRINLEFPEIKLQQLIDWASVDLFRYLGMQDSGKIQIHKKPGLNLISNIDFHKMKLTSQSELKVLV